MTVIAYRDGVMAADSGSFSGNTYHGFSDKLARAPDGTLYGAAGTTTDCRVFLDWVRAGCVGDEPPIRRTNEADSDSAAHVLRVRPGRDPEMLTAYGVDAWVAAPYAAIGGAASVALGALHAGAGAFEAVEAAIAHHNLARGPVRTIRHEA